MKKDGLNSFLNFFYYYYFVLSIINLIFVCFNINILYNITTVLIIISMIIELLCGYIRGVLGITGYIITTIICFYINKDLWLSIVLGLSITHILRMFFNLIFSKFLYFLDKKLTKK